MLATQRVRDSRVGRLGTVTPEGRPHLVPVCFALLDEVAYTAVDAKPKSTLHLRRLQNIETTPTACLLVDHYDENWSRLWWVRLDGQRESSDRPKKQSGPGVPWRPSTPSTNPSPFPGRLSPSRSQRGSSGRSHRCTGTPGATEIMFSAGACQAGSSPCPPPPSWRC